MATVGIFLTQPQPAFDLSGALLTAGLVALLSLSPIPIGGQDALLTHSVTIASGLFYGPREAILGLALGQLIGETARLVLEKPYPQAFPQRADSFSASFGQHALSLSASFWLYLSLGGTLPLTIQSASDLAPLIGLAVGFLLPFLAIQWLKKLADSHSQLSRSDIFTFILIIGFIPVPYAIVSAAAAAALGETVLLVLGGGPAIVAPIVRGLIIAERGLKRRFEELSTLGEVSQAMRTSLNLEAILHTIYLQVAHLLEVRNFYVALYQPAEEALTYPLAIKGGQRQQWATRPISDRLTDRVVLSGEPILIPSNAPAALREMGLPELNNAPEAWLGVPLVTPSRTLGCLGVFHQERPGEFTEADQDLLITIAGQASVAIENAMLYDQTRQRARALASLNEISAQMSSSLDPDQTLSMVAQSLIRVVEGQGAAIYLRAEAGENLELVQSVGLPESFSQTFGELSLQDKELTAAFHSGHPKMLSQLPGLDGDARLKVAGYSVSVDLPLSTPSGVLGMATVFFSQPSKLREEQLELLETFVAQSALAVANARAHAATDQALQRQVEQISRLEAIGRDMVSTLDTEELFDIILSSAMDATGAPIGHLALAAGSGLEVRIVAHHGFSLPQDLQGAAEVSPEKLGLTGMAFLEGQTLQVDDTRQMPEHSDWTGGSIRSLVSVPISRWGRSLGVLTVESRQIGQFGQEETRFLSQVASYASVAITNANLYQQLENNLREQSLLYQASTQIATSMDVDSVALAIADSLVVSISAVAAAVYRSRQQDMRPQRLALTAARDSMVSNLPSKLNEQVEAIQECIETGLPAHFEVEIKEGKLTAMSLPLHVGAQGIGAIVVFFESPHEFSEAEIRTAQTIASQAAIALQNTDLFRRIRESRDRLDAVINSTKEGILMVDQDGRVLLANQPFEHLMGVEEDEIVGSSLISTQTTLAEKLALDSGQDDSDGARALRGLEEKSSPDVLHLQEPSPRVLERMVRPVTEATGGRIGWLIVLRDVSEAHELEESREQLVEMIVHDLRSPLTTIQGGLSLLNKALPEEKRSEVTTQALSVSDRAVSQMLGLVNSLLDLARLENSPLEIRRDMISLDSLLDELSEIYVPEANQAGLILSTKADPDLPEIAGDEEKLRRVITNLLDNALKFTPEGGHVQLLAKKHDEDHVRVEVADDGPGVPEEMQEKIFERFAQVPGAAGRRRGTGLGLAFAKLAIEGHGGSIWVEPNNGKGSRFIIELPVSAEVSGKVGG